MEPGRTLGMAHRPRTAWPRDGRKREGVEGVGQTGRIAGYLWLGGQGSLAGSNRVRNSHMRASYASILSSPGGSVSSLTARPRGFW